MGGISGNGESRGSVPARTGAPTLMQPATTLEEPDARDGVQPRAWYTLSILVAVALASFVDRQILGLLTEQVARSLALRDTQIGLIQGLGSVTFATLAIYPLGWLTDRFDRRLVLGGCVVMWSVGTAACGLAQGFWTLFLAVVAISAGEAGLPAIAYAAIPELFAGKRRVLANQVFYVALILSSAVGIGFGGAADLALEALKGALPAAFNGLEPWRLIFFLVSTPAPILLGLIAATRLGARSVPPTLLAPEVDESVRPYMRRHGKTAVLVLAALSLYGLPFLAILSWTPAGLTRLFAVSPAENGLGLALGLGIGCIFGVLLAARLLRVLRPRLGGRAPLRISAVTLLASLPLAILYGFVSSKWEAFALVGALMASGTLIGSLLPGILQGLAPPNLRGRIIALYGILSVFTGGFGVSIVGPFSDLLPGNPRALLIGVATLFTVTWSVGALLMRLSETPYERLLVEFGDTT